MFRILRKSEIKSSSKSVSVTLKNFDFKRDSPLQINRESFIMGCIYNRFSTNT